MVPSLKIFEEYFDIIPAWPQYRKNDVELIPSAKDLVGSKISVRDFSLRAKPVFEWSKHQNPECRHMVVIVDKTAPTSKVEYRTNRLQIEEYFYKYEASR